MNCLVLGGTGFIGKHLCKRLAEENHNVRILGRKKIEFDNIFYDNKFEFVQQDFLQIDDFSNLLDGIDIVFHLISTTIPSTSEIDCVFDISSNVISTLKLLKACVKMKIKKIVFISSGGTVYGIPVQLPIPEEHPTNPICSYGIQKLTIENYLYYYFMQYGLDYTILRLSNPYGTGQYINKNQGVIPIFIDKLMKNETLNIWGDGKIIRDYIYIDDAINGIISTINYTGKYKIFNIGSGEGMTLLEVVDSISEILGCKYNINYLDARKIDVPVNVLDVSRAEDNLLWKGRVTFEEAINSIKLLC
ncbi:NAD-dependent epimerase/dehydratase [Paenibacillus curdlanolyticus YK9]|uniref:NAD-dependent epimerase/dehydratase n=1 Tax=Paenibacillus curdlanolyticus YK9 TaxID=717606 RepID=E0I8B9_9BACL|nr:NAD-dependent epimerase/dehydratase family protein [Paenibacillus curdlanolyticus]EFM11424.1 NAD-dependent epimerase/dehydratase [Paenibacillus curdlanolyticus YK9]